MAVQSPSTLEEIRLSGEKVRHDLRVSLLILLSGAVLTAGFFEFEFLQAGSQTYASSTSTMILLSAIGGIGSTLIFVGALFAAINWALLWKPRHIL
jgi:hypothetical protein